MTKSGRQCIPVEHTGPIGVSLKAVLAAGLVSAQDIVLVGHDFVGYPTSAEQLPGLARDFARAMPA